MCIYETLSLLRHHNEQTMLPPKTSSRHRQLNWILNWHLVNVYVLNTLPLNINAANTGAHSTEDSSIKSQVWWKLHLALLHLFNSWTDCYKILYMTWAELCCSDMWKKLKIYKITFVFARNGAMAKLFFQWIWIMTKKSLVKWAPCAFVKRIVWKKNAREFFFCTNPSTFH